MQGLNIGLRRYWRSVVVLVALAGLPLLFASAASGEVVVRSFNSNGNIYPGWVVALAKAKEGSVELAKPNELGSIYGVVIDPSEAPLTVQKEQGKVFVATSGTYKVFVSNQNGNISTGDYLSMSSLNGIAAKAKDSQGYVLGRAVSNFTGGSRSIIKTQDGFAVGEVMVSVSPMANPGHRSGDTLPEPLSRLGSLVSGKAVSPLRVYAALVVFITCAIIASVLLLGGIRSSIIAIGRNPLSKHSIMQSLLQVLAASATVFIVGLFGIYLLLKV